MFTGKDWGYVSQTKKESNGTKAACKSACHGNVDGKSCMDRVIDRGVVTHCARKRTGKADFAVRISSCGVCGGKCRSGLFAFCRVRCFGIGTCRGRYFALCCVGVITCACLWHRRQCFAGTQGAFMCGISAICHDRSQACLRERCREAAPVRRGLAHASEPPQAAKMLRQQQKKAALPPKEAARTCKKLPVASFCASETAETGRIANGREQGDHVGGDEAAAEKHAECAAPNGALFCPTFCA